MHTNPTEVANVFIACRRAKGEIPNPLKVIKLTYLAYGLHAGLTHKALFKERPEAWEFGPTIPSLYHALKKFGMEEIPGCVPHPSEKALFPQDSQLENFLRTVDENYGHMTTQELCKLTSQPNSPWDLTWEKYHTPLPIPLESFHAYYKSLMGETNKPKTNKSPTPKSPPSPDIAGP
jgi:uncharacterized phage-associated protein